ncbi:MAG: hypothetical protein FJ090_17575 [Deltaproteobacteria bacterium]|nr:hypothetical protein [Deltaproteobacteria bacterium]
MPTHLHAPAAVGDVLDRISILDIKLARVGAGREHVARERAALVGAWNAAGLPSHEGVPEFPGLGAVNLALWEVEDRLRACEARGDFGPGFVADARLVYQANDRRAALKRAVNLRFDSALVEVKEHPRY